MKLFILVTAISIVFSSCTNEETISNSADTSSKTEVLLASEIRWEKLNPARGDKSPQAGTLWGNRKGTTGLGEGCGSVCPLCSHGPVPTGFLARFVDGFSSPPHIHNVTYRAVVISGLVHNNDPGAAPMWMSPGSFWTQPKGEVHITAAKGESTVALVEIDTGPYLVMPPEEAFDSGEKPVNVDASNLVWTDLPGMPRSSEGPKVSYLWGNLEEGQSNGTFIKFPPEFSGALKSHGTSFRSVVIKGQLQYHGTDTLTLDPSSYLGSSGPTTHQLSNTAEGESVIYIRTNGQYELELSKL
ncbi:MAG: DUF4437 domain-containing protein [Verrucomicrobiota bacterium]